MDTSWMSEADPDADKDSGCRQRSNLSTDVFKSKYTNTGAGFHELRLYVVMYRLKPGSTTELI